MATRARVNRPKDQAKNLHYKKQFLWIITAFFVIIISFWAFISWYSIQTYSDKWEVSSTQVILYTPKYLSANEDEDIRFAVKNIKSDSIHVTFQLVSDDSAIAFMGLEGSNVFYSGIVQGQRQVNRQLKLFFPVVDVKMLGETAGLSLWGSIDNAPSEEIADLPINISPIPWARTIGNYLGTLLVGVTAWLIKELWNQIKEPITKVKK